MVTPELLAYIKQARLQQIPEAQIAEGLLKIGWTPKDINQALSEEKTPITSTVSIKPSSSVSSIRQFSSFSLNILKNKFFWVGFGFLLLMLTIGIFIVIDTKTDSINISDQSAKNTMFVKKANLVKGRFIIIRGSLHGLPNVIVGMSPYLAPDTYKDFEIALYDPEMLGEMKPKLGNLYFAMIYQDSDNDRLFNETKDQPVRNWLGKTVSKKFFLK